jgi:hypothetical protein
MYFTRKSNQELAKSQMEQLRVQLKASEDARLMERAEDRKDRERDSTWQRQERARDRHLARQDRLIEASERLQHLAHVALQVAMIIRANADEVTLARYLADDENVAFSKSFIREAVTDVKATTLAIGVLTTDKDAAHIVARGRQVSGFLIGLDFAYQALQPRADGGANGGVFEQNGGPTVEERHTAELILQYFASLEEAGAKLTDECAQYVNRKLEFDQEA